MRPKLTYDDSLFQKTFKEYVKVTSRTLGQAVNDKLFMVARAALWNTQKADKRKMAKELGKISKLGKKDGQMRYRHRLAKAKEHDAPAVAVWINARRGKGKGLYGAKMRQAVQILIGARNQSIAYIKSGWLPAIQALGKISTVKNAMKNFREDKDARQIGKAKGEATPASPGVKIWGMIKNSAAGRRQWSRKHQNKEAVFEKVAGKGLQAGLDHEWKEMKVYVERKMRPDADRFNKAQR